MESITIPAPAKINLALDIRGLREDGFHEVEMIMQSISLHDIINIKKNTSGVKLSTSDPILPQGRGNIAYQAAEKILKYAGLGTGVDIDIKKNIPIAGGLAGGSSNAAAVLLGINRLYNLKIRDSILMEMAAELGSDVPFCFHGGTVLAYGRGEKLRQLNDINKLDLIVVNPGIEVNTAWAYKEYDKLNNSPKIPIADLIDLIESKNRIDWTEGWNNVLEGVVTSFKQDIIIIKELLIEMGVIFAQMSGSGSTVFAVVKDQKTGKEIIEQWPRQRDFITIASTVKKDFSELWRIYNN